MLSEKYDQVLTNIEGHNRTLAELNERTEKQEEIFKRRNNEFVELSAIVYNLEQCSRPTNLNIHGLKKKGNKNVMNLLQDLLVKLGDT